MTNAPHIPVMLDEVLAAADPQDGDICVDATFGAGGYARALLEAADCRVIAFDRDPDAVSAGQAMAANYAPRLTILHRPFSEMAVGLDEMGVAAADVIVFDIGVSSMQLDQSARGFSFQHDGPIDMRMGQEGETAADLIERLDDDALAAILRDYGEERRARRVARAIKQAAAEGRLASTRNLAAVVAGTLGHPPDGKHPATKTFQALRIAVNDELGELEAGLAAAERLLKAGGRLVVVAFHSLEDRMVKRFLAERAGRTPGASRHAPAIATSAPTFAMIVRGARKPSDTEAARNPRARSARLRAARRLPVEERRAST